MMLNKIAPTTIIMVSTMTIIMASITGKNKATLSSMARIPH